MERDMLAFLPADMCDLACSLDRFDFVALIGVGVFQDALDLVNTKSAECRFHPNGGISRIQGKELRREHALVSLLIRQSVAARRVESFFPDIFRAQPFMSKRPEVVITADLVGKYGGDGRGGFEECRRGLEAFETDRCALQLLPS